VCSHAALPAGAVGLAHPHPGPQRGADSPLSLIRGGRRALTLYPVLSARVQVHLVDDALPLEEDKGFLALPKAAGEALAGQAEAAVDAAFEALLTAWPLDAAKAASARNHVLDRLALGGPDRLREPLRALPLLPRYGAEPVSLAALDAHWAAGRGVAALGPHEVPPAGWDAVADPHEWVLVLPPASLQRLERLLQDALPTVAERLEVVQGQQAFAARPEVAAALPADDPSVLRVRFERRHIEGGVGWAPPAEPWALRGHTVHVRLHHQGRLLCALDLPSPVRGLRAAVAATHLTPTATLDGVVPDEALADVHRAVLAGARRLLYRTPKAQRDGLGPLVADLIRLSCPDPGFAAVWAALHADRPAARAQVGYALRLAAAWDGVDPARILQDPLAEPPTLTPDLGTPWGELALILSGDPVRKQDGPLATRVLDALPGNAAQLPLAQGPAGPLSGESLRAAGEAAPAVLVVPPETEDPGDGALRVTGVDPEGVAALVGERLTDEAGWATRQRRAAVRAAQPPRPTPPAGALGRVALQGDKLHGVAWLAPG
ncbi:MAG: hypothetical protein KC613_27650, partial [Myxococcales bacterium]|nr:hypothetical protein [Myxococcales bacterium]